MASPTVSILTPVYNGAAYLAECIDSIRAQTFVDWEYIVVNNRSTDRTHEIAADYARRDSRISVVDFEEFVGCEDNHNRAFRLISQKSKYCKVVSADDWIVPQCLERMVALAEKYPSVGVVAGYQLSGGPAGWKVTWDGLPYSKEFVAGRDICRWHLLGGPYLFGNPTSMLFRSDIVRSVDAFFPGTHLQADRSACYEHLRHSDFGFVHEVLSFARVHEGALTAEVIDVEGTAPGDLKDLLAYGKQYLTIEEYTEQFGRTLSAYYEFLAVNLLKRRDRDFWQWHERFLKEIEAPLYCANLAKALAGVITDLAFNPKTTLKKVTQRLTPRKRTLPIETAIFSSRTAAGA